jgi:hypothetical protein
VPAVRYYYTPAPVYLEPATCAAPAPLPVPAAGPSFAQPTPAPPSQTKEPPPGKKDLPPPKVTESRSFSIGVDKAGTTTEVVAKATCRVGFWNISGRDVALNINGQTHVVPANRNVTVMLNREFSWHVEGQQAQQERLPDDKTAHEIVIR